MIYPTRGIVLKTVKYGETSVIVAIFTELFGIQSYLINGIRKVGKLSGNNALFQPSSILEMNVYHYELKNLQRIKDYKWYYMYQTILSDVTKNAVATFMVEILHKCLKQPENNVDLYNFCEDCFIYLDTANQVITANFPLFFMVHLAQFFGFKLQDNYKDKNSILDLQEGAFTSTPPSHGNILDGYNSFAVSQILKANHPRDLAEIKLNKIIRSQVLDFFQFYYAYHIQDFGVLRTLPIVQAILL